ncbi:MAG: MoxR family ATPase [Anaerolineales bacterium]|nr:MoxR family ATPase [Anaerolineales bacterium]
MRLIQELVDNVASNVEQVILGKQREIRLALIALLCEGHILIEDVPGVGKTLLAKAIAKSLGLQFKRIQFTPDLLPSDVTGVSVFNQRNSEFEFREGPIFANIVLADEVNRATPKTQSALLEAMEERQATIDGQTRLMPRPFLTIATQNPIEYEGTFPLPEAQLDRFLLKLSLGYPDRQSEIDILSKLTATLPIDLIDQVVGIEQIVEAQTLVHDVYVDDKIKQYIVEMTRATREHPDIYLGASPRGSMALYHASQALAASSGRDYVIPDDVKHLSQPTLAHRLIISPAARIKNVEANNVLQQIVSGLQVPGAAPRQR